MVSLSLLGKVMDDMINYQNVIVNVFSKKRREGYFIRMLYFI